MKEIEALAENPAFVVFLDAEPLAGVHPAEPPLQFFQHRLVDRRTGERPRLFGELKIHLSPVLHRRATRPRRALAAPRKGAKIAANRWRQIAAECWIARHRGGARNSLASPPANLYPLAPGRHP